MGWQQLLRSLAAAWVHTLETVSLLVARLIEKQEVDEVSQATCTHKVTVKKLSCTSPTAKKHISHTVHNTCMGWTYC